MRHERTSRDTCPDPGDRLSVVRHRLAAMVGRIARREREAVTTVLESVRVHAAVAGQAGDVKTLLRDQLSLIPEDSRRLRDDWHLTKALLAEMLRGRRGRDRQNGRRGKI